MTEVQKKSSENPRKARYSEEIPKTVLEQLPEEVVEQYILWDQIVKREIELYPKLLLPLIKEVFYREYSAGTEIVLIATEYVVRKMHEEEGSTLNPIHADITVRVGKQDIYHLECQMNREKGMILRMLEYDIHIGLAHSVLDSTQEDIPEVILPRSVILYLYPYRELPSEEKCIIRFADGTVHEFRVPVVAVQQYSPSVVAEKHLDMLIPFLPIRFKPRLGGKDKGSLQKDLTEFVGQCIMIIEREKENGTLTSMAVKDLMELLSLACAHLLKKEPELNKEVQEMILPEIHLMSDDIRALEAENEKLEAENEKLRQLEPEFHLLRDDLHALEAKNEKLETQKRDLEEEIERLRQQLKDVESKQS